MVGAFGEGVLESMWNQASELGPFYSRRRHLAAYLALQDAARSIAIDPAIGFALLHLPVPHEPPIYDRRRGAFSVRRPSGAGYYDNLALADRSLGELRRAMEAAGTWIGTTLFVFGDHGRRAEGNRIDHPAVPFIVKLAGQAAPARYEAPFNLVLVHDLTLAVLTGRLTAPEDVSAWLDARRSAWPAARGGEIGHASRAASRVPCEGPPRP
jgi:arylsulfatase A-like enzyme